MWKIVELRYFEDDGTSKVISKHDAVLVGNLIRLLKLNTSFLQNTCEQKLEICYILGRCLSETYVNIKYILIEGEERVRRNYIKNSLITEKELWEIILSNASYRGGDKLPIEKRMQASIKNSFDDSDFELDEVNRSSKWKTIKSRAEAVAGEEFYNIYYGFTSHAVHGNWQDILSNNLQKTEDGFRLICNWRTPRPQIIDGPIILNLDLIDLILEKELLEHQLFNELKEECSTLQECQNILESGHEQFINSKNGL